ncbi:hypothetical protein KP79_PYT01430 [Mizuhopecten yessoensis]|uniref:Uncharacterized protein n=1 Tax=Mizuhopecten yessoensis TaxID=6573 RepID=A0A210QCD3_MIZYE|nr:hypothetical protein KP79_PYT01430 [Mizuhopecten yessoensis]
MDKFGMDSLDAEPNHLLLKTNIKFMQNKYKKDVFHSIMDEVIQELVCTFPKEEPEVLLNVDILDTHLVVNSVVDGRMLKFDLNINNNNVIFNVTPEQAKHGVTVDICVSNHKIPVRISKAETGKSDDLHNYVMQFLQWYFLILTFKYAIKEGDSERTNMTLKFCIQCSSVIPFCQSTLKNALTTS